MSGPPLGAADDLVVRAPRWLGDFVMALPTLRALAADRRLRGHSGATRVLAPPALQALLSEPGLAPLRAGRDAGEVDRLRGHDVALLLTGSFRGAWAAWRAGIPRRVGWFRDGRGLLLTDGMRPALAAGQRALGVGRAARVLARPYGATCVELVGLLGVPVADTRPRLDVAPAAGERVRARLRASGLAADAPYVAVQAGARSGAAKGVPAPLWAPVLAALAADGLRAVLVGGPGEEAAVLAAQERAPAGTLAWHAPPLDLRELVALFAGAALVLTSDSGPRHLAAAVGAPLVAVLGPTDPRHTGDHLERTRIVRQEVACGPCHAERCPLAGEAHERCLRTLEPASLVAAARALLARAD